MGAEWREFAACQGLDPKLFYGEREEGDYLGQAIVRQARKVCDGCPVQLDCLEDGLRERFGVWGGKSPKERRSIYRSRHRGPKRPNPKPLAPCGTLSAYRRHLAEGEDPCEACKDENRRVTAERRANWGCWRGGPYLNSIRGLALQRSVSSDASKATTSHDGRPVALGGSPLAK